MKFNLFKGKEYETVAQFIFRIVVIFIAVFYFASLRMLPAENDENFEVNLVKKYDYSVTKDDILYKGNFEIVKKENVTEPIELPTKVMVPAGEKVSIVTTLPDDYNNDYIVIRSSQEDLTIYIGGMARVIYNTENTRPVGSQTTSRYVFCRTSEKDAGKELKITVSSPSPEYSCKLNEVYTGDRFIIWRYLFKNCEGNFIIGIVGIGIGLFVVAIGICVAVIMGLRTGLENAGWCIFLAGVWVLSETNVRQLLSSNSSSLSNICFIVIMLGAIPLLLYLDNLQRKRYTAIYKPLVFGAFLNVIAQFALQIFDVYDFLDMLYVSHIVLFVSIIVGITLIAIDIKKGYSKEYKSMVIGSVTMLVCLFIEAVSAYFVAKVSGVFMIFGIVVFTFCSFFDTIQRYKDYERKRQEDRVRAQKEHSDKMTMQMIKTLSDTLEAKDEYTKGHSYRVAEYSVLIAKKLGLSEKEISKIHYAASLHDIGKIGVADTILNKPGKLTNEEYSIIKTHPVIGADIIKGVELIAYTEDVARYHHERYDGKGYPCGLKGEEIPFYARIVAVADSYDAMNSKRIYRKSLSKEIIRSEIEKNKGLQFDPQIADTFLELFDSGELELNENGANSPELNGNIDNTNVSDAEQMISAVMNTIRTNVEGTSYDFLTGLMLRNKGETEICKKMVETTGVLLFFDMDNLKTVNDLYGHKVGDMALRSLGEFIGNASERLISFRAGGDEFVAYYESATKDEATKLVEQIISQYSKKQADNTMISCTSLSVGMYITTVGDSLEDAMNKADKALYHVKKSGKNGYAFYNDTEGRIFESETHVDLDNLITSIKTSGTYTGSLNMEYREFTKIYEYIVKMCKRYEHTCNIVLITLDTGKENTTIDEIEKAMECMGIAIKENIRNVDVCTRYSSVQYLTILLEAGAENIDMVMQRVFARYYKICEHNKCTPSYQVGNMR